MTKLGQAVKVPTFDTITFVESAVSSLDALVSRRKEWEATDYKKANETLYLLLADCLEIYLTRFLNEMSNSNQKALRTELTARLKEAGIKVQSNSQTLTMLVRFVFGSDRKRAHGYTYVLKAAIAMQVSPKDLPRFITAQGGVEEIKRVVAATEETLAKREQRLQALNSVKVNAENAETNPLTSAALSAAESYGQYAVLIAKPTECGLMNVVAVLRNAEASVIESLFKRIAREEAELAKETDVKAQEVAGFAYSRNKHASNDFVQQHALAA